MKFSYHEQRRIVTALQRPDLGLTWSAFRFRRAEKFVLWAFLAVAGNALNAIGKIDLSRLEERAVAHASVAPSDLR